MIYGLTPKQVDWLALVYRTFVGPLPAFDFDKNAWADVVFLRKWGIKEGLI